MFEKNKLYKGSELHDAYGGNRQKGISNCAKFNLILIFTNPYKEQDVYIDEWKGKYFHYSGEGRSGDMTFTGGNI
jgi:5-methylcytosine-specific restriction enzyme A